MKKLLWIASGLTLIAVAALLVISFSLGSIVKAGINRVGPGLTGSSVVLEHARISPFSGKGSLTGLTIGNPPGWQTPRAFYLGETSIDVDPGSLRGDHIIVNSIIIESPEITYESRLLTSNLQDLIANIQKAAGSAEPAKSEPAAKDSGAKPVKIEIRQFRLRNAKVIVTGAGNTATVQMAEFALDNLGTREGGLTPEQLAVAVMKDVTAQAIQEGARVAIEKGLLDKAGAKLGDGLQKLLGGDKK